MKTSSSKAKGRELQKLVRDKLLNLYPWLSEDDIRSAGMGQGGEDIQLSAQAKLSIPFSIECKRRKSFSIYKYYEQAESHDEILIPLLVIRGDHKKPLAVVDLDIFLHYMSL